MSVPKIVTRPSRGGREAHQAAQGRGLAGAVAAEQRRDLAFRDLEADAMQDMALAVIGVEAFGLRARALMRPSPDRRPARPRWRRFPAAFPRRAGRPGRAP